MSNNYSNFDEIDFIKVIFLCEKAGQKDAQNVVHCL